MDLSSNQAQRDADHAASMANVVDWVANSTNQINRHALDADIRVMASIDHEAVPPSLSISIELSDTPVQDMLDVYDLAVALAEAADQFRSTCFQATHSDGK